MFWDKVSGLYDIFETVYNGKVYRELGKRLRRKWSREILCWIPIAAVKELERVCKSGGKIIIPTYINASEGVNSKAVRLLEIAGANLNGSLIFILIKNSLEKPGIKMFVFL